jgi:hypothetical protein
MRDFPRVLLTLSRRRTVFLEKVTRDISPSVPQPFGNGVLTSRVPSRLDLLPLRRHERPHLGPPARLPRRTVTAWNSLVVGLFLIRVDSERQIEQHLDAVPIEFACAVSSSTFATSSTCSVSSTCASLRSTNSRTAGPQCEENSDSVELTSGRPFSYTCRLGTANRTASGCRACLPRECHPV